MHETSDRDGNWECSHDASQQVTVPACFDICLQAASAQAKKRPLSSSATSDHASKKVRQFLQDFATMALPSTDADQQAWAAACQKATSLLQQLEADAGSCPELAALLTAVQ